MSKKRVNKRILNLFKESKKTVLFFMILFSLIFAGYIYMVDDRYESQCSIDVGEGIGSSENNDIIDGMIRPNKMDMYTKIAFFKSPKLLEEVIANIPIHRQWYKKEKYKWKPIDNEIPFDVMLKGTNDLFLTIHPLDDKQYYKLSIRRKNDLWAHKIDKNYRYGSWVDVEGITLKVLPKDTYTFDSENIYGLKQFSTETVLDTLEKNIVIEQIHAQSSLLSIKCYAETAKLSQDICINLMKVYHLKDIQKRTQEATQTLAFIDEQLQKIDGSMFKIENNISKNVEETELFTPKAKKDLLLQKQIKYTETLEHIQETIKHLEVFKNKFEQNTMTVESGDVLSSNILDLLKSLHDATYKRKQLRRDYTALHPAVKVISLEIAHYRKLIKKSIESRKENLLLRSKNLKKKLKKVQNKFKVLPREEKIYNDLEKKFVVNEQIYAYFLQKRATTAIVKASIMHKNKMIKSPTYSNTPIYPHRLIFIVYGLCFGLLFGIVFVLIREYLSDKIKNEAYIREYSNISLLGTLPHSKNQHLIEVFKSPKSLMSESLRALRGNLQFLSAKEKGLILSVTSTISGEGKTAVSSNLAAIISLRSQKVIVLNMDLRKPTLHHKFKADNTIGISNYLSRHNGIEDVIQHTEYENIDIIASGPIPPNPSELIENGRIDELIGELKMSYDVIILDTPPIGLVNDAMKLMRLSDIVLYVLREGYSKKIFLDEVERLRDIHKISTISLVLNDVKRVKDGYGYYEE